MEHVVVHLHYSVIPQDSKGEKNMFLKFLWSYEKKAALEKFAE